MTDLFRPETIEESLAQIWEQQRPGSIAARHFRESVGAAIADAETTAEAIRAALHGIGEPSKRAKHDGGSEPTACRRHVECLAATVEAILIECGL